ncbi:AraC family transcriptional regulator [Mycobacterium frederiksbergense]|uniref:AraC family transcriptional regulator n=1 Tax=Mycolicibacterium frederiksbergense TaxID=117567 RepID=A0ABT6L6C9_9MYCO|nr:helix-turn-helix transcriptional regulator [Mycolicibacterium frederiksbergense]MDH6198503.1 AraC family transcriptional regulator [Mycolicibacterium frederiksbergense]
MERWDGERALSPRVVLGQRVATSRELSFRFPTEQVDAETDWCCLDNTRHLIYVHRVGQLRSMDFEVDWGPSGRALLQKGDIWVIPAGRRCSSLVYGDTASYCEISIPGDMFGDTPLLPRINHKDPLLGDLVEAIYNVADRDDVVARLLRDSAIETLRLMLSDSYTPVRPHRQYGPHELDDHTCSLLIEYLEDGLDTEISLESLAGLARMPVNNFLKAFRSVFHTSPYQYLLDRRIDCAKNLLLTSNDTITEISAMVGFSTPNQFTTAFRRRVGVSPRDYRTLR